MLLRVVSERIKYKASEREEHEAKLLKRIVIVLVLMFFLLAFGFMVVVYSTQGHTSISNNDDLLVSDVLVEDKKMKTIINYSQYDKRWAYEEYAEDTIATSGCGLVAATSAFDYLFDCEASPLDIYYQVGSSCTVAGVNDMALFIEWFKKNDESVQSSGQEWYFDGLKEDCKQWKLVFMSISGQLGDRNYGGHIVLLYWGSEDGVYVMDPACESNCRKFSWSEIEVAFNQNDNSYYYSVWKEGMNDARN